MEKIGDTKIRLLKTLFFFWLYFVYSFVISKIFANNLIFIFISDVFFLLAIIFAYRKNIKNDFKNLKKNYKLSKLIRTIVFWVLIIFIFNILCGAVTDLLLPDAPLFDDNTASLRTNFLSSSWYIVFKTMIFSVIAEELLYRESVYDVVKNKYLFVLVSSIIYTLLNFIFTDMSDSYLILSVLSYFLPALLFSAAYYKNKSNIIILMFIKFIYNLIPTILFFIGIGK